MWDKGKYEEAIAEYQHSSAERTGKDVSAPANYLITSRYIDGLRDMARSENAKVVFMPAQTSRVLGSTGVIKEMLSQFGKKA